MATALYVALALLMLACVALLGRCLAEWEQGEWKQ